MKTSFSSVLSPESIQAAVKTLFSQYALGLCKSEHNSKQISGALFTAQAKLLDCEIESCDENFRFINQGHVKGEYRF